MAKKVTKVKVAEKKKPLKIVPRRWLKSGNYKRLLRPGEGGEI